MASSISVVCVEFTPPSPDPDLVHGCRGVDLPHKDAEGKHVGRLQCRKKKGGVGLFLY